MTAPHAGTDHAVDVGARPGAEAGVGDTGPVSLDAGPPSGPPPSAAPSRATGELSGGTRTALLALSVAGGLLVVASIVLAVVLAQHQNARSRLESARADAVSAARQAILNLDSLSAATIDDDLKRVLAGSTGSFRDQFGKAQADLKAVVVQHKTASTGSILSAGVVRADTDTATVLVAVDRTVKDSTNKNGAVAHDRWKLTLEKHGGRWLVADLQPVS